MISLFHIPSHTIDTSKFSNLLHDKVVKEFEEAIAEYVGARYAVGVNSATSAIFLILKFYEQFVPVETRTVKIPSIIPPVVCNAIITAGWKIQFTDDVDWVGGAYMMEITMDGKPRYICDSAQELDTNGWVKAFYKERADGLTDMDFMFLSFYPTKPVGSCDGGMIVSSNQEYINEIRANSYNGMQMAENNWDRKQIFIGYKMYMNSIQAAIGMENFKLYPEKLKRLDIVRRLYNHAFSLKNTSDHLYRVFVKNNKKSLSKGENNGIKCGLHYAAMHMNPIFSAPLDLRQSSLASETMLSIPFHEELTLRDMANVIDFVKPELIS